VEIGETVLEAVQRELKEETHLDIVYGNRIGQPQQIVLSQEPVLFGVYSDPRRDNRRHTVSVAFAIHLDGTEQPMAADDVKSVQRIAMSDVPNIDFFSDQKTVVLDYLRLLQRNVSAQDFVASKGDFADDIHRSVCAPFHVADGWKS
jgi:8-oxo-dGTP diphosphatase